MGKKKLKALKYDNRPDKIPWDLLPVDAVEGMLKVLWYGGRKYTVCGSCKTDGAPTKIYPNARLDGDPTRDDCPKCGKNDHTEGDYNWKKGFLWTRLIAAAFRHLKAILQNEDVDPESGLPHVDHLMCMAAFISEHQKNKYGKDDRWKDGQEKEK
jgi:hypothetical protein